MSDGSQYGYGLDPMTMALLSSMANKGQSQQTDYMQNLVSLLLDPKFAALGGNFDPMILQPQQFTPTYGPTLMGSLNSTTPIISQIAQSIIAGQIDPMNAVAEMAAALGVKRDQYGDTPNAQGLSYTAIEDMVSKMFTEAGQVREAEANFYADQQEKIADNVFSKAGLPQPTEQYTAGTVPRTSAQSAMLQSLMSEDLGLAKQRAELVGATTAGEKAARRRFDKAAAENPTEGRMLEFGVPMSESEAVAYANQLGVKEDWFLERWRQAANRAGEGATADAIKMELEPILKTEMRDENFFEWVGGDRVDEGRAKKILNTLESGKFFLQPIRKKMSADEQGEVKRFRNVAAVQSGRDVTADQRKALERRQDAFDFKSGLASAMLSGAARGKNAVSSPLQDALLSRLNASLGM
jgi:hypothetical protein